MDRVRAREQVTRPFSSRTTGLRGEGTTEAQVATGVSCAFFVLQARSGKVEARRRSAGPASKLDSPQRPCPSPRCGIRARRGRSLSAHSPATAVASRPPAESDRPRGARASLHLREFPEATATVWRCDGAGVEAAPIPASQRPDQPGELDLLAGEALGRLRSGGVNSRRSSQARG